MPTHVFVDPQGREHEIQSPEGGTRDQAFEVLQARLSGQGGAPETKVDQPKPPQLGQPTQEGEDLWPYIANQARLGFYGDLPGLIAGAGDVATMPFRAVQERVFGAPKTEYFPNMNKYQEWAPGAFGYDPHMPIPKDVRGKEKLSADALGHIARFAGGSVVPSGGVVASAAKPISAAAREIASIVLSGEGATMGKHAAPKEHEAAGEFAGSLTGPGLVAMAGKYAAGPASKIGEWAKNTLGVGATEAQIAERAAQQAAEELTPQLNTSTALENMREATNVATRMPGFGENLTLGQATNAPSVIAMQKSYSTTNPATMERATTMAKGMENAIAEHTERRFPSPPGVNPVAGAKADAELKISRMEDGLKRLEEQEAKLAEQFPRGDMEGAGAGALGVRDRLQTAAKGVSDEKYAQVYRDIDALGVKVGMTDIRDIAAKINRDTGNAFQDKPGVVGDILRRYSPQQQAAKTVTPPGGRGSITMRPKEVQQQTDVPFSEFHSLYKKLGEEIAGLGAEVKMTGSSEAAQKSRMLGELRGKMKSKLDEFEASPHGDVVTKFKEANDFYRTKYAEIFKRNVGGEMVAPGAFGRRATNEDANIFKKLVLKPNDPSGVKEYLTMIQGDKQGLQALEDGVMDIFAREVLVDGKINAKALAKFKNTNYQSLEAMPWIAKKIDTADNALKNITANRELVLKGQRDFAKSELNRIYKSDNPEALIDQMMKQSGVTPRNVGGKVQPTLLDNIMAGAKTPQEKQSVARAIMESVSKQKDPISFLASNAAMLEKALGKQHVGYLATILNAKKIAGRVQAPEYLQMTKLGDPLQKATGTSVPSALSDIKSITNRFASPEYIASRLGMRYWNKQSNEARDRIMVEAIYNPEVAASLAKYLKAPSPKTQKALDLHLIPYGVRSAEAAVNYGENEDRAKRLPPGSQ